MRPENRRRVIASAMVIGLTMLGSGCAEEPEAVDVIRPVRAMRLGDASDFAGRVFPGRAKATREVDLSFRVAGPLVARPINVGDAVVTGQELATIDPRDFEVRLKATQAQLGEAQAARRRISDEFQRISAAHADGAATDFEVTRSREAEAAAIAREDQLSAAVETEEDLLGYTHLRAPFEGSVVAVYVENFEDVRAKQVVLRLLDDTQIEMVIEVPEQLISLVPLVTEIKCQFDAFPDLELPATIKEIGAEASQTTRTYPVTLIMDQPEGTRILPGMTGEVTGRPPAREDIPSDQFEVPMSAVLSNDGASSSVWIIDDANGTVSSRAVELGRTTPRGVLVSGLEPGVWIATAGVHYLHEGQQVRIIDQSTSDESGKNAS